MMRYVDSLDAQHENPCVLIIADFQKSANGTAPKRTVSFGRSTTTR
jgi:hypothetical protein